MESFNLLILEINFLGVDVPTGSFVRAPSRYAVRSSGTPGGLVVLYDGLTTSLKGAG